MHNREDFWEIAESIIGKFLSVIDTGLAAIERGTKTVNMYYNVCY